MKDKTFAETDFSVQITQPTTAEPTETNAPTKLPSEFAELSLSMFALFTIILLSDAFRALIAAVKVLKDKED